jgi:pectin methylesterase-like acyl-CoA thioesterase
LAALLLAMSLPSTAGVFDHCRVTADPDAKHVFLGRPWKPYSTVVFRNTQLDANIEPAGWREWHPGKTHSLDTSYYAEFHSRIQRKYIETYARVQRRVASDRQREGYAV